MVGTVRAVDSSGTPGRTLVAIVGPTGSGKSELAIEMARQLRGEIVSCDALQVYRELDVGTAKVRPEAQRGIPHHLLGVIPPTEEFSAAEYIARAAPVIEDIAARGRVPVVVGGTGLYLRALLRGLFEGPGRLPAIRARLSRFAERRGTPALHRLLTRWDPVSAERIHPNDRVRLERALEVRIGTGRPMSELMAERTSPVAGFEAILVGLEPTRSALAQRIERRVARMFDAGFATEVRELVERYGEDVPAFKAIGYREALAYVSGKIDLRRAQELIVTATLQYAKRQMTWFRREEGLEWFAGSGDDPLVLEKVSRHVRRRMRRENLETFHAETAS